MRAPLMVFAVIVAALTTTPAAADEECAAWCGDGEVWSEDKGDCVPVPSPRTS